MKTTRFAEILSLVVTKQKSFDEIVISPYFNKNSRVTLLWNYVKNDPKGNYTKEELHAAAAGGNRLTEPNFRMVLADFVKLAEIFLLLERNDLVDMQRDELIDLYRETGKIKSEGAHKRLLKNKMADSAKKDISYYNKVYMSAVYDLLPMKEKARKAGLKRIDENTDNIWLLMKLENMIKSQVLGYGTEHIRFSNEILSHVEANRAHYKKHHPELYSRWRGVEKGL